jgi:peptidyl-prolyl cis-trans isomerase C
MPFRFRAAARHVAAACLVSACSVGVVWAQSGSPPASGDPILAKVDGQAVHLSDVREAVGHLPQRAMSIPPQTLYPLVLNKIIDSMALAAEAHRTGADKDPEIQRQVAAAEQQTLATAMLEKGIAPLITDDALHARYTSDIAGKPAEDEVHARHILVNDEATAKKIIAELNKGADFAALAKQYSKDPGAAARGGDLGFFKKSEMVPAFADAAFALQTGKITQTPVHTQFGWHVIQVLARRQAPQPTFEQARDRLRQQIAEDYEKKEVAKALAQAKIERFNPDGSPARATDGAQPPPNK